MPEPRLFLIDAHALCYRSYFAIKELSTSYGQATNAVYGFLNTLRKIQRDFHPPYMAICFDVGKKTRRQEKYAEYKIHRPSMPQDLISQIPLIKEAVAAYNLASFELEGFEADDVIATIATKISKKGVEVIIVSGYKDMLQLVDDNVKIFSIRKDSIIDYKEAKKLLGIDPHRITDYLGLAGDQSDHIPGVKGIGEVTARDLINQYGTIENMFTHIDKIKSEKLKEKILEQKDMALLSKELAILDKSVPLKFDLDRLKVTKPDNKKLFEIFKKLEFRKLAEEISEAPQDDKKVASKTLNTVEEIKSLSLDIQKKGKFCFLLDCPAEAEGALFSGIYVSLGAGDVYSIPGHKMGKLKDVFEDEGIIKISHDMKEGMKILGTQGIAVKGEMFDCMLAGYLLSPSLGPYDVGQLAWAHLKVSTSPNDNLSVKTKLIFDLYSFLHKELEEKALMKLFREIEIPLAYVLFRMETEGVAIDEHLLKTLSKESEKKIDTLISQLYKLAGEEFNLNSPKQLSHILFEKLKLPVVKKTKTGLSTDEGVLTKLASMHELPALILEYRQLSKLKSTYIDALPKLINPKTKRLHASFNQTGTETGRLSSNNPNLQNIPIRTELGRQIRKAFVSRGKDFEIISADYSQIELRILAHLSGDKNLIKAFQNNQDIHAFTAHLIFDVDEKKVTAQMRNCAKRVNFGIIYGISAFGLSKDLEISQEKAQEFIDKYFLRYPDVKKFMENEIKKAEKNGFVLTLMNRRRYLPEIKSGNMAIRQLAQRQAINTPVQGSAADLIKLAMINIQKELEKKSLQSKMIITVHDELVFDAPQKEKAVVARLVREQMENPITLAVPIAVTMKAGKNWLDMEEI